MPTPHDLIAAPPPVSTQKAKAPPPAARRSDLMPLSNALLFLVFSLLAATGLALEFRLDHPTAILLGMDKRDWARVHAMTALSFLSMVALHLWVNRAWLRGVLSRLRWRAVVIATVGLTLITAFLIAPVR